MLYIHHKIWSMVLLLVIMSASLVVMPSAAAQATIDGRFREYWQEHGGLPIFGLTISDQSVEPNIDTGKRHQTQWFERNRFELHEANDRPYDVLLGRLGVDRLKQLGRDWQSLPKAAPNAAHYFAETGHAITHDPFWRYWSSHGLEFDGRSGKSYGESLALFGLPLSEPTMETNTSGDRVLTQWFERARFEDHGAKGVLLGLLGNEVRGRSIPPEPTGSLKYFWPQTSPLTVWHTGSYANDDSFVLHLAWPHVTEPDATISGGAIAPPPEGIGTPVTVRGQNGRLYTLGARLALSWTENNQFYMIDSNMRQSEILTLAHDLEVLNLQTFRSRLQQAEPPSGMQYFWPDPEEHELSVLPAPHGGSFAEETSFKLNLYRVHSRQPDVTISGGGTVQVPGGTGRSVTVRGQRATAYTTSRGTALVWTQQGNQYMVDTDFTLADLLDFSSKLQVLDLQTFRSRIQPG